MKLFTGCLLFVVRLTLNTAEKDYDIPVFSHNSQCLGKEYYFDDQNQKCQQVPPCDQENHCSKDGKICTWQDLCEPEFCKGPSNCLRTRKCIHSRCMENSVYLCVYKEICTINLPYNVSDYVNCTVDKHNDEGTNESVPIDHTNNCFHIRRTPRALNAKYIFSCQKGDHRIYSNLEIEIRDQASEPQLKMPAPPYYEGETYNFVCSIRGLLQEPKSYAITIGEFNCTTSYSHNKRSGKAVLGCRIGLTEHDNNKKLACYFQPRNEPKKVTEGYNIVLTKLSTLPLNPEDSGPGILTSQHIDNKNESPTRLPTAVGNDTSGMDLTQQLLVAILTFVVCIFIAIIVRYVHHCFCKKKTEEEKIQLRGVDHENCAQQNENAKKQLIPSN